MTEHYFLTITASYLHQTVKKENQKKEKERQTNKPYNMIATMRRESKLVANTVTILPSFLPSSSSVALGFEAIAQKHTWFLFSPADPRRCVHRIRS
jgi:hypothetical protein